MLKAFEIQFNIQKCEQKRIRIQRLLKLTYTGIRKTVILREEGFHYPTFQLIDVTKCFITVTQYKNVIKNTRSSQSTAIVS